MKNAFSFYKFRTVILPLLIVFLPCHAFSEEIVLISSQGTSITEHPQAGGVDSNHGGNPIIQAIGSVAFRSFPIIAVPLTFTASLIDLDLPPSREAAPCAAKPSYLFSQTS